MFKWIGKVLCFIGWHDARSVWLEDGHGNSGAIWECKRCEKFWVDDGYF